MHEEKQKMMDRAKCPVLSFEESKKLLDNGDEDIKLLLAMYTKHGEILVELSKSNDYPIAHYSCGNPNFPSSGYESVLNAKNWFSRYGLAMNPKIPLDVIERLSKDKSWLVRRAIALNENTSLDILEILSMDSNRDVSGTAIRMLRKKKNDC